MTRDDELKQIEEFLASGRTIVCEDSRRIPLPERPARIRTHGPGWRPGQKSRKGIK